MIGELNQEQDQANQAQNNKRQTPFSPLVYQFYQITKGFLNCLNEQIEQSISYHLSLNEFTTILI